VIKITYDKEGDILEIKFSDNPIEDSEYMEETGLVVDYDKSGKIVAVEVISFSKKASREETLEAIAI